MRIALASDWHLGITKGNSIRKCLKEMKKANPDIIAHLGDYCGGEDGARSTEIVFRWTREICGDTPIIGTTGNHEMWCKYNSLESFLENNLKIQEAFAKHSVHYLDQDGPFRLDGTTFVGSMMWYGNPTPPTNDLLYIYPYIRGDTHRYLSKTTEDAALDHLNTLTEEDTFRVFCSHFPIWGALTAKDKEFGGNFAFGDFIKEEYKIDIFLNGHSHKNSNGPIRYECGSDYGNPKFKIIEI